MHNVNISTSISGIPHGRTNICFSDKIVNKWFGIWECRTILQFQQLGCRFIHILIFGSPRLHILDKTFGIWWHLMPLPLFILIWSLWIGFAVKFLSRLYCFDVDGTMGASKIWSHAHSFFISICHSHWNYKLGKNLHLSFKIIMFNPMYVLVGFQSDYIPLNVRVYHHQ